MIRVLLDTNVLISAIIFGGLPRIIMVRAAAGLLQLVTSRVLLDELERKLRDKFFWEPARLVETRAKLEQLCEVVSTTESLHVIKVDPDDNRVLEAALDGRADYIVSGDKHVLSQGTFRDIPILTVRQFLDLLYPPA